MHEDTFALAGGPELPWPILRVVNARGGDTGFCAVRGPLARNSVDASIDGFMRGHRVIGVCSRGVFPGREPRLDALLGSVARASPAGPYPYTERSEGWAHCFRWPERYLPAGLPRALLSESDFKDPDWVWRVGCQEGRPPKRWDVIYVCGHGMYHETTKNMALGVSCVYRLCASLGFRALVVGCNVPGQAGTLPGYADFAGELPWHELMECLARSRMALFPNNWDPSPRLLTEALCLDVPVLVNRDILGGWKYVTSSTGEFFDAEADVAGAAMRIMQSAYNPRAWFVANHGPGNAGRRLAEFVASLS